MRFWISRMEERGISLLGNRLADKALSELRVPVGGARHQLDIGLSFGNNRLDWLASRTLSEFGVPVGRARHQLDIGLNFRDSRLDWLASGTPSELGVSMGSARHQIVAVVAIITLEGKGGRNRSGGGLVGDEDQDGGRAEEYAGRELHCWYEC